MARPTAVVAVPHQDRTIVLALDVSRSMCASDIEPTRLEAAQRAAIDFVSQQAEGTRIGLVAFSGFAAVIQAPTVDRDAVIEGIASLTTGRRTAVGSGILSAIDAIAEVNPNVARSTGNGRPGTEPPPVSDGAYEPDVIVLLTDGATNAGIEPEDAAPRRAPAGCACSRSGSGPSRAAQFDPACAPQYVGREPGRALRGRRLRRRPVPARDRRGRADRGRRADRRHLLAGRKRGRALAGPRRAADLDHHAPRAGGALGGVRRARGPARRGGRPARSGLASAALDFP